jgi:uncharacterized protein
MSLLDKQLYIKKSTLIDAGMGLFTKKPIAKGRRITEYKGRIQQWKDVKNEDGYNGYLMYINRNTVINGLHYKKTFARYANDAVGLTRIRGLRNNAEFVSEGSKCFLEALRDINPGEEIFSGYGKAYWDLIKKIRKNSKKIRARS